MEIQIEGAPSHVSHSSYSTYVGCGNRYWLQRVAHVDERPMWASLGGTAVHEATEEYDLNPTDFDPVVSFCERFTQAIDDTEAKTHWPRDQWTSNGKPGKLNGEWWVDNGPGMVKSYVSWRERTGWEIWASPDGEYGVELPLEFKLPNGVKVVGYIDRVFVLPDGSLVVVDVKTGKREPYRPGQLGTYSVGLEVQYGARPMWGAYWTARDWYGTKAGQHTQLKLMHSWTQDRLAALYGQMVTGVNAGVFLPNDGMLCDYCTVQDYCTSYGGSRPADLFSQPS